MVKENYDIIILAGQSNAHGCGLGETTQPWVLDERINMLQSSFQADIAKTEYGNEYLDLKFFDDYSIESADERVEGENRFAVLALPFAREYADKCLKKGRKVLIVQSAIGGTGFAKHHWGENEILFNRMMEMILSALALNKENRIVAFLWHQGEHDAFENADWDNEKRNREHEKNLSHFMDCIEERFGQIPFICAGFSKSWVESYPQETEAVLRAIKTVCESKNFARFIEETTDLPTNNDAIGSGDTVHFSRQGLEILAKRYFEAYQDILKGHS